MPKRKRPKRPQTPKYPGPHRALTAEEEFVLAQSVRRYCGDCGSPVLGWGDLAAGALGAPLPAVRAKFTEAVAEGFSLESIVWWCDLCGNVGIFANPDVSQSPWG